MPDAKPMSPARLAEIERILCSNATWWQDHAIELVAEVKSLRAEVESLAARLGAALADNAIMSEDLDDLASRAQDGPV